MSSVQDHKVSRTLEINVITTESNHKREWPLGETYGFSLKTVISRMYFILLEQMTDLTEDVTWRKWFWGYTELIIMLQNN